jgi:hypothetical protein
LGIPAPDSSVTNPDRVAPDTWAGAGMAHNTTAQTVNNTHSRFPTSAPVRLSVFIGAPVPHRDCSAEIEVVLQRLVFCNFR